MSITSLQGCRFVEVIKWHLSSWSHIGKLWREYLTRNLHLEYLRNLVLEHNFFSIWFCPHAVSTGMHRMNVILFDRCLQWSFKKNEDKLKFTDAVVTFHQIL